MRTKFRKMLPKTIWEIPNGGIYKQAVGCGKANCKCARGEKHVAYYFFTRIEGKLTKTYIRKAELDEFKRITESAAADRNRDRQLNREADALIKRMRQSIREREQMIKDLKKANS